MKRECAWKSNELAIHCPRIGCADKRTPCDGYEESPGASLPDGEYAIVEQLGHRTMIGRVVEVERFGTKMLQTEPIWKSALLPPVLISGASIYQITPCSRAVACNRQATQRYQLPDPVQATLPPDDEPKRIASAVWDSLPGGSYEDDALNRTLDEVTDVQEEDDD